MTPIADPSEHDPDPPSENGPALFQAVAARFPEYGYYPVADPLASIEKTASLGDAIDDIADITRDVREVVWRSESQGLADAHWSFQLNYFHREQHARELSLYLYARQFR